PVLIALTGYGRSEDRSRALAAGFDGHLTKPVQLDILLDLLAKYATRPRQTLANTAARQAEASGA
ncbi:MAG: hypothetical protein SFU86_17895, partial [Pirellulaceae bacterium]|nr:hypothetical protein [Pirellulaceae bacterium]